MNPLSGMTNADIIELLQAHRQLHDIEAEKIKTWFVEVDTGEFIIRINSTGADIAIDHIKNCAKVMVEIYDRGEMPSAEDLKMPDLVMEDPEIHITFSVQCFPHTGIKPNQDIRFKGQPWAKPFTLQGFMGTTGACTLDEVCDILRYCVRLPGLTAFL